MPDPSNSPPVNSSSRSAWERWLVIWHVVFYLTLAFPTILALLSGDLRYPAGTVLGLSIALGVWYALIWMWLFPRFGGKRQTTWSLVCLVGAVAMWFPLGRAHPAYYLTASFFYGLMWGTLPLGVAAVGNILMTGLIIWSQALNINQPIKLSPTSLLVGGSAFGWSLLLALWMRSVMRESAARKNLIEQLEAAQSSLAAAERQAGILQERQRLAQEIHDTLAQGFTSIVMQLEVAEQSLPSDSTDVQDHLQKARHTARASLAEARRLVQALRPEPLEEAPLSDALRRVANRWARETGIQTEYSVTGDSYNLHPEVEVTLLRAMQEALTNIYKHAQAQEVSVTLSYMQDQVALDVQDNGRGFDPEVLQDLPHQTGEGFGLQAMRERLAQLGGSVIIESSAGQGTTLVVQIPIDVQAGEKG